jgi:hypothetical protein
VNKSGVLVYNRATIAIIIIVQLRMAGREDFDVSSQRNDKCLRWWIS